MSEAELLQGLMASIQAVTSIFSMFVGIISAYIAALYFFLNRAPVALKLVAFFLLSIGLVFLAGAAAIQQQMQEQLFNAWDKLASPTISVARLRNPMPVAMPLDLSLQEVGVAVGWITAAGVYLALAYMTFFYRWKVSDTERAT